MLQIHLPKPPQTEVDTGTMHTPKLKQTIQQAQSLIASVVPALYGSLLLRTSGAIALTAVISSLSFSLPVYAALLEDWKIDPSTGVVEVLLPPGVRPRLLVGTEPPRLVVDLPDTEIGINITERFESGVIRQVSFTQPEPEVTRMTVDFVAGVVLDEREVDFRPIGIENLWVLRPTILARPAPAPAFPIVPPSETPATVDQTVDQLDAPSDSAADLEEMTPPEETATGVPLGEPSPVLPFVPPRFDSQPPPPPPSVAIDPQEGTIPFGQPLPRTTQPGTPVSTRTIDRRPPNVILPTGTALTLRYPNPNEVRLRNKPERQDVLLLQGGIVDQEGNFIIPPDTPIVGYFETSSRGSRFQVEAINLDGRSIPLRAESPWISGTLDAEPRHILRDTGIGSLGLFLLTGFTGIGLLVGAVGGAAVGLATSPQPTTLEPNQVIEVRLIEDLRQSQFVFTPED